MTCFFQDLYLIAFAYFGGKFLKNSSQNLIQKRYCKYLWSEIVGAPAWGHVVWETQEEHGKVINGAFQKVKASQRQ